MFDEKKNRLETFTRRTPYNDDLHTDDRAIIIAIGVCKFATRSRAAAASVWREANIPYLVYCAPKKFITTMIIKFIVHIVLTAITYDVPILCKTLSVDCHYSFAR